MTGCRHDAKNTLVKNYLYLAEKIGAVVLPNRTVTGLSFDNKRWKLRMRPSWLAYGAPITLTADQVVVAAGTFNTQKLLHSAKASTLPKLSDRLGYLSRTNSEALVGTIMPTTSPNFSEGVAITSSFHPDEVTHVEPVRYGKGSNTMGLLQTLMTDGETVSQRRRAWWRTMLKHPRDLLRILDVRRWSERAVIALVMQNVDSSVRVMWKRGRLTSQQDETKPNATYISAANETARAIAREYNGIPAGHYGDLIGAPFTAHFVGGCVIGDSIEVGVIDPYHRVWNYPTMHVVDGSAITANLGVNPSLTITAQAERAFSMWPNRADADPRPVQGSPYQPIKPIMPTQPAVPAQAPAALNYEN